MLPASNYDVKCHVNGVFIKVEGEGVTSKGVSDKRLITWCIIDI